MIRRNVLHHILKLAVGKLFHDCANLLHHANDLLPLLVWLWENLNDVARRSVAACCCSVRNHVIPATNQVQFQHMLFPGTDVLGNL